MKTEQVANQLLCRSCKRGLIIAYSSQSGKLILYCSKCKATWTLHTLQKVDIPDDIIILEQEQQNDR